MLSIFGLRNAVGLTVKITLQAAARNAPSTARGSDGEPVPERTEPRGR